MLHLLGVLPFIGGKVRGLIIALHQGVEKSNLKEMS